MAIRFDDRIETNVNGDVLITGDQIKISTQIEELVVTSTNVLINDELFNVYGTDVVVDRLSDLPYAINKVNEHFIELTASFCDVINKNIKTNIDTTTSYFGNGLKISSSYVLQDYINRVYTIFNSKPVITFLSSPIVFSTNLAESDIIYGTGTHPFGDENIKMLPKNTLVYIFSTDTRFETVEGIDTQGVSTSVNVMTLDECMQVLSIPVSADDIHNDFESRINNIENLLALKK